MTPKKKENVKTENGITDEVFEFIKNAEKTDVIKQIVCAINNAVNEQSLQQAKSCAAKDTGYCQTYKPLLAAGKRCKKYPSENHIKILALAAYGWMPTIMDSVEYNARNVKQAIEHMKSVRRIDDEDAIRHFEDLSRLTNNSYVGVSKFLHFLFPASFAIFDSRIEKTLNKLCGKIKLGRKMFFPTVLPTDKTRQVECFILYELAMRKAAKRIKKSLRDIEQVLFYYDEINKGDKVDEPRCKAHG